MARMQRLTGIASAFIVASALSALAEDSVTPVAVGARLSQDMNGAELSFDLSRPVNPRVYALASPDRIVVDLPEVNFQLDRSLGRVGTGDVAAIVKAFRFGLLAPHESRIIIDLARSACPARVESKPIVDGALASRLKIELKPCDEAAFSALAPPPDDSTAAPGISAAATQPVVVLDPGHGGSDGGARGVGGALEKTLVLAFCDELNRQLESTKRYKVVMTRHSDEYVDLDDRVKIAREANASLFVSIHADTLSQASDVSGTTVYTVADRASDAEAARIATRENAAGQGAGKETRAQEDPGVADILFDLKRRETRLYAHMFSRGLVDRLRPATRLNHNPERSAGFVVLKAPEFPSVLVELGYLSNAQDVQAMNSPEWRAKTASAMVGAIDAFFGASAAPGVRAAADSGVALKNRPANFLDH
ncbi:MAG TPA: N-acetylmuramoyl-L-alanine amidase [Roseiarcus sp.]|nr:N-acetylmuramoyl-L-alanine amidase [Roseiarcus sp.]